MIWMIAQTLFIVAGLAGVMVVISKEQKNRKHFEMASSFKMKIMGSKIDKLSAEMTENQLQTLKNTQKIKELAQKPREKPAEPAPIPQIESVLVKAIPHNLEIRLPEVRMATPVPAVAPAPAPPPPPYVPENEKEYTDTVIKELIRHAVQTQQVEMFIQPIQSLPERKTRYYEIFARIRARANSYIPANQYMDLARQENLEGEIDNLLLMRCLNAVQSSVSAKNATPYFVNITSATLKNGAFMKQLLGLLGKDRSLAEHLVFEMNQKDYAALQGPMLQILRGLGALGCSFSIDHVENFDIDVRRLMTDKVRFVKISSAALRMQDLAKTGKLKRILEGNGINVIAEKIEAESELRMLAHLDIAFVQGYLFGKPGLEASYRKRAA